MAESIQTWSQILPQGWTLETVYTYGAAGLVFIATIIVGKSLIHKNNTKVKIKELMERRAELKGEYINTKRKRRKNGEKSDNIEFMQMIVKKFNLLHESKIRDHTKLLVSAGYRNKNAVIKYAFSQGASGVIFLLLSLMFFKIDTTHIAKSLFHIALPFIAFYVGMMLPRILVINQRNKRWTEVRKGLPDALDLMMICTEAGLTLSAALDRVCKEMGNAYPELADELMLTSVEIGFLPERRKALENFAERVGLPEIRALTSILIQTEKYGTPVSQALRVLAKEFREQRMLAAEQKAARLPALMTMPMIMFILPTLFIVVISPAIISLGKH